LQCSTPYGTAWLNFFSNVNVPSVDQKTTLNLKGIWLDDNKIDSSANNVVAEAIDGSDGFKYLSLDGNDIGVRALDSPWGIMNWRVRRWRPAQLPRR